MEKRKMPNRPQTEKLKQLNLFMHSCGRLYSAKPGAFCSKCGPDEVAAEVKPKRTRKSSSKAKPAPAVDAIVPPVEAPAPTGVLVTALKDLSIKIHVSMAARAFLDAATPEEDALAMMRAAGATKGQIMKVIAAWAALREWRGDVPAPVTSEAQRDANTEATQKRAARRKGLGAGVNG
jgi:hypothetical protein